MFKDKGPIFTFQDEVLEAKGDYQKLRRRVFSQGESCEEAGVETLIDRFVGSVIDERIYESAGNSMEVLAVNRYFEEFAVDFRPQSKGGLLTFYLRDSYSTERKRLVEAEYKKTGILEILHVYHLPRYSMQKMIAGIAIERLESEELLEKGLIELDKDPVVSDLKGVFEGLKVAVDALDAASFRESARMTRVVQFGGFTEHSDFYINLDGQQQIEYSQAVRFNERSIVINRDKDKRILTVIQSALAPGHYQSCILELPVVIPGVSSDALGLPNQSWRNFFDELRIQPSVVKAESVQS